MTNLENNDIDTAILKNINIKNIDIDIDRAFLEYINIKKGILENFNIDREISENINIDKISNRLEFGILNRATPFSYYRFKS